MTNWKKSVSTFMIGQVFSLIGSMVVQYAIMWYVVLNTGSGLQMTIMILCSFVPMFLLAPFAGVWADRLNRKMLMIVADLAIALVTLAVSIAFFFGLREIWVLFVVSVFRSFGQAVHQPAVNAAYPQIVPEDKLLRIQGINQAIQSSSIVIMPIVAGVLLAALPMEYIFMIDVLTAILAVATLIFFVKLPKHKAETENQKIHYFKDIASGTKYVYRSKLLKPLVIFSFIYIVLVAPVAFLTPLQITRVFGSEAWYLVGIEISFGIGMLIGSLIISWWGGFKNRLVTNFLACLMMGIGTVLLGIPFNLWFYFGFMLIVGVFLPMSNAATIALVQEKVEPEYLGRVFSLLAVINTFGMPLGMLVFGPLADYVSESLIILGTGLAMICVSIPPFFLKEFMKEGLPTPKPVQVATTDSA